jgi:hypothetical protein
LLDLSAMSFVLALPGFPRRAELVARHGPQVRWPARAGQPQPLIQSAQRPKGVLLSDYDYIRYETLDDGRIARITGGAAAAARVTVGGVIR